MKGEAICFEAFYNHTMFTRTIPSHLSLGGHGLKNGVGALATSFDLSADALLFISVLLLGLDSLGEGRSSLKSDVDLGLRDTTREESSRDLCRVIEAEQDKVN